MAVPPVFEDLQCSLDATMISNSQELHRLLSKHGATIHDGIGQEGTMFFCQDNLYDYPEIIGTALERSQRLIRVQWVKDSIEAKRQLPWEDYFIGRSPIFYGLRICLSQFNSNDQAILWGCIVGSGGICQKNLDSSCTHLVATSTEESKYFTAQQAGHIQSVSPAWVMECCRTGTLLDESHYRPLPAIPHTIPDCTHHTSVANDPPPPPQSFVSPGSFPATSTDPPISNTGLPYNNKNNPLNTINKSHVNEVGKSSTKPLCHTNKKMSFNSADHVSNDKHASTKIIIEPSKQLTVVPSITTLATNITTTPAKPISISSKKIITTPNNTTIPSNKVTIIRNANSTPPNKKASLTISDQPDVVESKRFLSGCGMFFIRDTRPPVCCDWQKLVYTATLAGIVEVPMAQAHYVICLYKDHSLYQEAMTTHQSVVSPKWLYDVLAGGFHFLPCSPHHYAIPREPIPKTHHMRISVSGYSGRFRSNLQWMISQIGADYSGALERDSTTHLVCLSANGEKFLRARDWGIPIVNHKWLEDMYSHWTVMAEGAYKELLDPDSVLSLPPPAPFFLSTGSITPSTVSLTPSTCPATSHLHTTLSSLPETPSTIEGLRDVFPLQESPAKRFKLSPHVLLSSKHCDRLGRSALTVEPTGDMKTACPLESTTPLKQCALTGLSPLIKQSGPSKPIYSVLFTGLPRSQKIEMSEIVKRHHGNVVTDPRQCTVIVANRVVRTCNFLSAMSVCRFIVTQQWVIDSAKAPHFLDPGCYALQDKVAEYKYGFCLSESMKRAAETKLLEGMSIYISPHVMPSPSEMRVMIELAGGKVLQSKPSQRRLADNSPFTDTPPLGVHLVITVKEDLMKLDLDLHTAGVFSTELILSGILCQHLDFALYRFYGNM